MKIQHQSKLDYLKTLLCALLVTGLVACGSDDDDDNDDQTPSSQTETVTVQGTAVKGTLANAQVDIFAAGNMDTPVASGSTDENGEFEISFEQDTSENAGTMLVKVMADDDTSMTCDADKCGNVNFGDQVPASDLTGLELVSHFALDAGKTSVMDLPVNTLTTAATEIIINNAENLSSASSADLTELQTMATELIMSALGVSASAEANLFNYKLPDASMLSDGLAGVDASEQGMLSQLAMLNASFAAESDMQSALNMFSTELSTSLDNNEFSANLATYIGNLKMAYSELFDMLNALDGGLPTGANIPEFVQVEWPDNIDFTGDGIVIDPDGDMEGDWTLVVTGTYTISEPVTISGEIPSVTIENTMPPAENDTSEIEELFTDQTEVQGVTVSNVSFEMTENTASKVVIEYQATISVAADGVTSTQTQDLTYTWTKN